MEATPSLKSSSTPHLNGSLNAHRNFSSLKETVNVTSTSSLHTPLTHSSEIIMDEQLRRSMPDLLDKLPNDHNRKYTDSKVNTLPHKRNKNKIVLPTPSSSFMPLNIATHKSQQSPSPAKNSLSQSTNSAFSRVTPDKLSNSDSNLYHSDGREALNRNEENADEPVLDHNSDLSAQQAKPAVSMATIDMTTTNGPQDNVAGNYQVTSINYMKTSCLIIVILKIYFIDNLLSHRHPTLHTTVW